VADEVPREVRVHSATVVVPRSGISTVRPSRSSPVAGTEFSADIRDYERIHRHIPMMADAISTGIIKQFPRRSN
jgi:hypothetical protein